MYVQFIKADLVVERKSITKSKLLKYNPIVRLA